MAYLYGKHSFLTTQIVGIYAYMLYLIFLFLHIDLWDSRVFVWNFNTRRNAEQGRCLLVLEFGGEGNRYKNTGE